MNSRKWQSFFNWSQNLIVMLCLFTGFVQILNMKLFLIWFAELTEQFQVHNSGTYIALIILWNFWMVWTASSHFRVVLTSNDLILSSPCQENRKREMWTISDKKLNAFLAFLTLSWAELSGGLRLWSFQKGHFTKMLALLSCWQRQKHEIFVFVNYFTFESKKVNFAVAQLSKRNL